MNFKRGRAKNQRAGCLMCKPHKMNGAKDAETLEERIEDQPEEGSFGNSRKKRQGQGWPRRVKISCRRCGRLIETRTYQTRRDYDSEWLGRHTHFCSMCPVK